MVLNGGKSFSHTDIYYFAQVWYRLYESSKKENLFKHIYVHSTEKKNLWIKIKEKDAQKITIPELN